MRAASGVGQLDRLLGGLFIGDNVVWHDDAGSLSTVYCMNFIQASQARKKPIIYISFDRSPKNLFGLLGPLAKSPMLTVMDCFTYGKGEGAPVFLKYYEERKQEAPCRIIRVNDPRRSDEVMETLYGIHSDLEGDVRIIFESVTGMQELWGGEEQIINFYSHSCPRLYELNTIAYWVMAKGAHSNRLRAMINQIAQVAIDLSIKRGKTYLTIQKAERRNLDVIDRPYVYWSKDLNISFETEKGPGSGLDLGPRLKELRTRRGFSQTELAKQVGVTPSNISQIESNLIYPSVPALFKMAEVLQVEAASFFRDSEVAQDRVHFPATEAIEVKFADFPAGHIRGERLTPVDFDHRGETYLIEIPAGESLPSHFFRHKGEEMGYLISGKLDFRIQGTPTRVGPGDLVYLASQIPSEWKNSGKEPARLLWITIR